MPIDRAAIDRVTKGGMGTMDSMAEAPAETPPPSESGGDLSGALGAIASQIESGEMDRKITRVASPMTLTLAVSDYPDLEGLVDGAPIVAIVSGTAQGGEGGQVTLQLTETAIVSGGAAASAGPGGKYDGLSKKMGPGPGGAKGVGAWLGRRESDRDKGFA